MPDTLTVAQLVLLATVTRLGLPRLSEIGALLAEPEVREPQLRAQLGRLRAKGMLSVELDTAPRPGRGRRAYRYRLTADGARVVRHVRLALEDRV